MALPRLTLFCTRNPLKPKISQQCLARFAHLDAAQLSTLLDRADQLRRRSNAPAGNLDSWVDRVIRSDQRRIEQASDRMIGVVSGVLGPVVLVDTPTGTLRAEALTQSVVAGDEVTLAQLNGSFAIIEVAPRRTKLSRSDVGKGAEQIIIANVDVVVIVVSVVSPPLHPRLIDRYLVAIQQGGAEAAVFVNKLDLLEDRQELECLDSYSAAGVAVLMGSAAEDDGFEALRDHLRGRICAFVGHSGVGKSSIVNRLMPEAGLDTGSVSDGYGRGTHTTTTSSRHCLPDGTVLIDTPGVRSFGLHRLTFEEVLAAFPEFEGYGCRYADCTHLHEPDCGVQGAVESGAISEARYEAYVRLRQEAG